jgi:hypothetical protein
MMKWTDGLTRIGLPGVVVTVVRRVGAAGFTRMQFGFVSAGVESTQVKPGGYCGWRFALASLATALRNDVDLERRRRRNRTAIGLVLGLPTDARFRRFCPTPR